MDREEKLRKIFQEPLETSKQFDDMLKSTLNSINNNEILSKKRNFKWITKIAAVLMLGLLGTTVWAGVSGKLDLNLENIGYQKVEKKYEENAYEVNKRFENEYFDFNFESIAADPTYIITEYRVSFKDKFFDETGGFGYDYSLGYNFGFEGRIAVNEITKHPRCSIKKVSENEFLYMNFIDITDLESYDDINLEIRLDNFNSSRLDWTINYDEDGTAYYDDHYFKEEIDKTFRINFKIPELENGEILAEQKVRDNTTIQLLQVGNTKFENYMKVRILKSGTWNMTQTGLETFSYLITDENDTPIRYIKYSESTIFYDGNTGNKLFLNNNNKIELDYPIIMEENYFIRLESNIEPEKLNIQLVSVITDKNSEFEKGAEIYENADWYDVEEGEKVYSAVNNFGDELKITKTEINDESIIFYYEANGSFPNGLGFIIRNKSLDNKINYVYSSRTEIKGINSNENRIIFSKENHYLAGLNKFRNMLDDDSQLQFTMLFSPLEFAKLGEKITVDFPEESSNIGEIVDIKMD